MKQAFSIFVFFLLFAGTILAQAPPPPPSNPSNDGNGPVTGGSAPIGGGIEILLLLGAAYGVKKAYKAKTSNI
jgi:hypothetical protein